LSLAGIWPLAGFWSKEGILHEANAYTPVLFWLAMITVFMTAFYMFRAVFLTFHGEYRGGVEGSHSHGLHESPKIMIIPLVILAIFAVIAGRFLRGGCPFQLLWRPHQLVGLGVARFWNRWYLAVLCHIRKEAIVSEIYRAEPWPHLYLTHP